MIEVKGDDIIAATLDGKPLFPASLLEGETVTIAEPKMTVRDVCETVISDLKITFDEYPYSGVIDVIIPVSAEPKDILGEGVLNLEVNLMMAKGDALIISTNSRR